jgi:hypothetical protein
MVFYRLRGLALLALLLFFPPITLSQQPAALDTMMADAAAQLAQRFPPLSGEVVKVEGESLYLNLGAQDNLIEGMQLTLFREGEALKHPTTGEILQRLETDLGTVTVRQVAERYAVATLTQPTGKPEVRSGDKVRITAGRIALGLLPLLNQTPRPLPSDVLADALQRALTATDRFRVVPRDQIAVWLLQRGALPEGVIAPDLLPPLAQALHLSYVLMPLLKELSGTAFLEVLLLSPPHPQVPVATVSALLPEAALVQRTPEPAAPLPWVTQQPRTPAPESAAPPASAPPPASASVPQTAQPPAPRPPAELFKAAPQQLPGALSWNLADALTEIHRLPNLLVGMDGADIDGDGKPEVATATDSRVSLYRLEGEQLVPIDTFTPARPGELLSVQLLRLGGSKAVGVVVNRQTAELLMDSFILTLQDQRLVVWQEHLYDILLAMDTDGDGINDSVWSQPLDQQQFFRKGMAHQFVPANGALKRQGKPAIPSSFRATGAALARLSADGPRDLVFVDQLSRLQVYRGKEQVWRSPSKVGGGYAHAEVVTDSSQGIDMKQSVFFEPLPVPIDIDGNGTDEVLMARNLSILGIIPGLNLYSGGDVVLLHEASYGLTLSPVSPQFNGVIAGLVALRGRPPSVLIALAELKGPFKQGGTTKIFLSRLP